jgi:hypothetical protein
MKMVCWTQARNRMRTNCRKYLKFGFASTIVFPTSGERTRGKGSNMSIGQRIMDSFRKLSDGPRGQNPKSSGVIVPTEVPPPVRYVGALLNEMADGKRSVTLRSSAQLPVPHGAGSDLPQFSQIVNRLKIMAGLDPVAYPDVVRKQIEVTVGERKRKVAVTFDDKASDPSCQLTLVG